MKQDGALLLVVCLCQPEPLERTQVAQPASRGDDQSLEQTNLTASIDSDPSGRREIHCTSLYLICCMLDNKTND